MLDDLQVGYFDSVSDRLTRSGGAGAELELGREAVLVLRDIWSSMRMRLERVKHRFNLTGGVHVQQRLTGCEMQDGDAVLIMFRDGSNGQDADSLMYNMTHFTYTGGAGWEIRWDALKRTYYETLYANIYLPFCLSALRHLLELQKQHVTRRVPPRVRLLSKQLAGGGARVTCVATEFYPRHINLTLLCDGRAVSAERLSGGTVLPNANGLYQVRQTLQVTEDELRRQHNYTCVAEHLSLGNQLQVSWRAELYHSHRTHAWLPVAITAAAAVLMLLLLRCWAKGRRHGDTPEAEVTPPPSPSESSPDQIHEPTGNGTFQQRSSSL